MSKGWMTAALALLALPASAQVMVDEFADIHAGSPTDHSITVSWTAENTFAGEPFQSYEMRMLALDQIVNPTDPDSAANSYWNTQWDDQGILVSGLPSPPGAAGAAEGVTVLSLSPATTYYFRLKAIYTLFPQGIDTAHFKYGIVSATTTEDLLAPAQVAGLQATETTATTIRLSWISPHEDAGVPASGPATSYEIYFAPASQIAQITTGNLGTAQKVTTSNVHAPDAAETYDLGGLSPEVDYVVAVRAVDDHDQAGPLSATINAKTLLAAVSTGKDSVFGCSASGSTPLLLGIVLAALLPALRIRP